MKTCFSVGFAVLVAFYAAVVYADSAASPAARKAAEECRAILEQNFQAINQEDIRALMATTSSRTAAPEQMAQFREEAEQMFRDTDVYMRVDGFEIFKFQPPYLYAYVNQLTMPKNEEDHYPREQGELNFRHHSALLPEHQLVQYIQKFHFENGQWKLHRVVSRPKPIGDWNVRELNSNANKSNRSGSGNCKNGKCSTPFVRVR